MSIHRQYVVCIVHHLQIKSIFMPLPRFEPKTRTTIRIWCSRPLGYDPASENKTKTMVSNWKSFSLEYFWLKYLNKFSWIGSWFHCFFNKEWNRTIDNKMYVETKVKKVSKNVQLSLHQRQVIYHRKTCVLIIQFSLKIIYYQFKSA